DVRALAGDDLVADPQTLRRQDVAQLAILVADQGDERRAVGIVLEPLDRGRNVELPTLEIDDAITLLVAATLAERGQVAVIIPAAGLALAFGQRLDRLALVQLRAVDDDQLAPRRRGRLECSQRHITKLPSSRRSCGLRPA